LRDKLKETSDKVEKISEEANSEKTLKWIF
jgi:hypothetical protein